MLFIITALGVFISMALVDLGKRLYIQYYIIYYLFSDSSSNIAVQSKEGQFFRQTDVYLG